MTGCVMRFGMEPRPTARSMTVTNEVVLPSDSNPLGSAFGGRVMAWIDMCASICAMRHCEKQVVTASMDELHFLSPLRVGMTAVLTARVNATFSKSLEVAVEVVAENSVTGYRRRCCSALLTFVALDEDLRPTVVPPLAHENEHDRQRQAEAEARRKNRLANRERVAVGSR